MKLLLCYNDGSNTSLYIFTCRTDAMYKLITGLVGRYLCADASPEEIAFLENIDTYSECEQLAADTVIDITAANQLVLIEWA